MYQLQTKILIIKENRKMIVNLINHDLISINQYPNNYFIKESHECRSPSPALLKNIISTR